MALWRLLHRDCEFWIGSATQRRSAAPDQRLANGAPAGQGGRHYHRSLQPHLPGHRDHRLPRERGHAEKARQMAAPASTRTTQLYDRREDRVTLDEVVKINIRG
jgi:hypothetical protein